MALTDYVIMPGESYKALCDMIREKTGETDLLTIQQLLEKAEPLANVSDVTATAEDVLKGKTFVDAEGNVVAGNITVFTPNTIYLTPSRPTSTLQKGYSRGGETVFSALHTYTTVTPTKETQDLRATNSFWGRIIVDPIPIKYQDVSDVTATAEDVLKGKVFVDASGNVVEGAAATEDWVFTMEDESTVTKKVVVTE